MSKWAITLTVIPAVAACAWGAFGDVVSSFQTDWAGTGLAYDGTYLWYWGFNHLPQFICATTTGSFVSSFGGTHYAETGGATFDGEYLWCAVENNIPPPRPAWIIRYTTGGSNVAYFFHREHSTPAMASEPGYLWVDNYKYTVGGSLIGSMPEPFPLGRDTAWDGSCLWSGGGIGLCRITTYGSIMASFATPSYPFAVTFDGQHIWAQMILNGQYWTFQYDIDMTAIEPASVGRVKALFR
jgi:hypothetical protein